MKTAIYIVEGTAQVVLTPENEHEKRVIELIENPEKELKVMKGSFYECRGGWYKEGHDETSVIIRLDDKPKDVKRAGV